MTVRSRKEQIEAMLADDPNDPFLRYGLAIEFRSEGNLARARECFEELLRRSPDYVPGYLQLGQLLGNLGEEEVACKVLRDGIVEANKQGNDHAAGEMTSLLATLQ